MVQKDDDLDEGSAELFDRDQIRDYIAFVWGAVRRRRARVAAVISGIMALATLALAAWPRTYHVEAKLLAQKNPVLPVRGEGPDAAAPTRGAVETIRRRDNLVALIEATDLVHHWNDHRAPAQRWVDGLRRLLRGEEDPQEGIDAMVERLEKRLVTWTNEGTVTIAIDWPDAAMACRLVDIAQQNFLETRHAQEITALAESIAILRSHAANLRADVDDAVTALEELRDKQKAPRAEGAAGAPPTGGASGRRPTARRGEPSPELERLQATINAKRKALDDIEELRRRRLSEMQMRLAEQRATYTENHPVIIDLQQTIAALQVPSPPVKALRDEVASLRAEQERMGGDARRGDIAAAPGGGLGARGVPPLPSEILRLDQELREEKDPVTVYARGRLRDAMDKYGSLCEKVRASQIDLETAQAAFKYRYSVLTPAMVPRRPVKPSVPLVLLGALVVAIFGAVLVVVVADVRSGLLVERWQIERLLDRPILGDVAVPMLPRARGHRAP